MPSREPRESERTTVRGGPLTRRTLLGTAGAAIVSAVAGCTSEAKQQPAEPLVDRTVRVEPGQYEALPFGIDSEQWLTVGATLSDRSVDLKRDGPAVDVVTMTATQYSEFQTTGTFDYVGGVSMPDVVSGRVSGTLGPGDYVALVDNSDAGVGEPDGTGVTAVVQLEITATDQRA